MDAINRELIIGDIGLQYAVEQSSSAPIIVARLRQEAVSSRRAVEYLRSSDMMTDKVRIHSQDGLLLRTLDLDEAVPVWNEFSLHPLFAQLLTQLNLPSDHSDVASLTPLVLLRRHHQEENPGLIEVLSCTRLRTTGVLFARVADLTGKEAEIVHAGNLVHKALAEARNLHEYTGTDFQLYTTFESGIEIEMKFALEGRVSPWSLASQVASRIGTEDFPGFIPDVGNEHQRWETKQETYEVTAPAQEVGYIAFIANASGSYLLKRKRFSEDGLRREETFRTEIDILDGDFDAFLTKEYPELTVRRLPSLTRAKFDVNVESVESGHFFGIEIDEVTVAEHEAVLRQVELEYHRTRVHSDMDAGLIDKELERLATLVEKFLESRGISAERTFYSKLSFLRDLI